MESRDGWEPTKARAVSIDLTVSLTKPPLWGCDNHRSTEGPVTMTHEATRISGAQ
jgi:hypothetical protein